MWFHSANGWECPAWSACTLVFNGWHHSKVIPLVAFGYSIILKLWLKFQWTSCWTILRSHQLLTFELFECHIRELVYSLPPRVLSCVMFFDLFESFKEDTESIKCFFELRVKAHVHFLSDSLGEGFRAIKDISVFCIKMKTSSCQSKDGQNKYDFWYHI